MSATGRNLEGNERRDLDFYETESWVTRSILKAVDISGSVLDAGCGTGSILREVIRMNGHRITVARGVELDPVRAAKAKETATPNVWCGDFLTMARAETPWDVIIANPPYGLAQEFVDVARRNGILTVFLLRLNFLGSQKRAARFREYMPDVYVLPKRPSFTGDGRTDATEYAWFVWGRDRGTWGALREPCDCTFGQIRVLPLPSEEP
jgi:SAM-dependent methyltransferase